MKKLHSSSVIRLYTLLTTVIGSVLSQPIRIWIPFQQFDVVKPEPQEDLTAEMYAIRILCATTLVLTGGFFAGKKKQANLRQEETKGTKYKFISLKKNRFDLGSYGARRN